MTYSTRCGNCTPTAGRVTGRLTPDLVVDGEFAEVKASIGGSLQGFSERLRRAQATRVFVNATASLISHDAMSLLVRSLINEGPLTYTRVIGNGYDLPFGTW